MRDVDRAIATLRAAGRPVESFEASVPEWYRAVFSFAHPWSGGGQSGEALNTSDLNALRNFGLVLDMMGDAPALSESQRTSLVEELNRLPEILNESAGLSAHEREYMSMLATTLADLLKRDTAMDAAELKALIDQLVGGLLGVGAELDTVGEKGKAEEVLSVVRAIVAASRTLVYDAAALAAIVSAVPVVQKMLEQ